jgi:hypothetical protein
MTADGGLEGRARVLALASLLGLTACSGADWQSLHPGTPYDPPPSINVQIIEQAKGEGLDEAINAFYEAIGEELASHGIKSTYWQGAGPPPPPALFVVVEEWEPGSRGLRWLCGGMGGCGEGSIVIHIDVRTPAPLLAGRIRGWVRSGAFGGSSANAAEAAAEEAGCTIARGGACYK